MKREWIRQLHICGMWMLLILAVLFLLPIRKVQAAGYVYPLEKTTKVQELDSNCQDAQGVKYTLDAEHNTAMVGSGRSYDSNISGYEGANEGVCVIPEKVSYGGIEYTVTTLDKNVFSGNEAIRVLVIPDTITEIISPYIWSNMAAQYLYIGKGLDLTQCSMENCSQLREVVISEANPYVQDVDNVIYSKDGRTLYYNPPMREGSALATYSVVDGTETIADKAFRESRYREIRLPASVKRIGFEAFAFCSWLHKMDLSNVEEISDCAFRAGDYSLQYLALPKTEYTIGMCIGDNYLPMRAVMLTKGMRKSNEGSPAFDNVPYLQCAAVQDGMTALGVKEFRGCGRLETVLLPDTLQTIADGCFSGCTSLKKLYIPPSVTKIGNGVLENSSTILYGVAGSAAEDYALEHGYVFVDVSSHDHAHLDTVTVYEDDYRKITAKYCFECGYAKDIQEESKEEDPDADSTEGAYDFQLSRRHEKVVLDRNMTDAQGVVYRITRSTQTASVVRVEDNAEQLHLVIPETVVRDGVEYIVNHVDANALTPNTHMVSVTLPDTIRTIEEKGLASQSVEYVYMGGGLTTVVGIFASDHHMQGIWISPANAQFYVKDRVVYEYNREGGADYVAFTYAAEDKDTPEDPPKEDTTPSENPKDNSGGENSTSEEPKLGESKATSTEGQEKPGQGVSSAGQGSSTSGQKKATLQRPKLDVKKKRTQDGIHYLQLNLKKLSGKYVELYVQKGKAKYKKVKLRSNRIKKKSMQLKIGYKVDGKKMRLKVRTYKKVKGKKKYSDWSKIVVVK